MIYISLINNNHYNQFYTIPYGTKTVPNENCFNKKPLIFTDKWPNILISILKK